jgi:hypothetical protein
MKTVSGPGTEGGISRIWNRNNNHSPATFSGLEVIPKFWGYLRNALITPQNIPQSCQFFIW